MKVVRFCFIFYVLSLFFLAIRPKVPCFYDNIIPSSDIGGWNMYQYLLKQKVSCYFVSENNITTEIDWQQHFYHSTFASSPHPNYYDPITNKFMLFLKDNNKKLLSLKKNNISGTLYLEVTHIKEKKDTVFYKHKIKL